ncbi:recombinase family protein [Asaccharospora irregularis]|uniref:Site-specific DNA recombinase n=1 Tax=Asaccharospora irregularis DSM 2635 TaxID=1121321 RepID=A0A1M5SBS9_9FIRM|nr:MULTISPECIES: recombinase family protein [Peptostreptococcaceae]SHH35925.1 Site-specific DNA recombinase [Asaccharospora irregularis DSM 2635]
MRLGYIRVSTKEQNVVRQELLMNQLNVEKVYMEKVSGKNTNRPRLKEMINFAREGDVVVVESISRFARNTKDLLELIEILKEKKVDFESQKERIDTSTSSGEFMLTIFGAMAQLERSYILDRQKEGIDAMPLNEFGKKVSLKTGRQSGRPRIKYPIDWEIEYKRWINKEQTAKITMERLCLKRTTFYKLVKEFEIDNLNQ